MEFVHFTDLHYARDSAFQRELIDQLLVDLKRELDRGTRPDFVIFSGDLVANPEVPGIYDDFERQFLSPVLDVLSLNPTRVVLCPGNHDVNRAVQKQSELIYESLLTKLDDQDVLDSRSHSDDLKNYVMDISQEFFTLANRYGASKWSNPFVNVHSFERDRISFIAMNSAFGCSWESSAADRGKLGIPVGEILKAFQSVASKHEVVTLCHHTFHDMNESTVRKLTGIIEKKAIAHCFGHVHQAKPSTATTPGGTCFNIQGGALYEKDGYYNGYSIIKVELSERHIQARYRSYYVDRYEFDEGTNVAPRGIFYSSGASSSYWNNVVEPPSEESVRAFLTAAREVQTKALDSTITGRLLTETFVEPLLMRPPPKEEGSENARERAYGLDDLLASDDNVVIGADNEFGSTSLLKYIGICYYAIDSRVKRASVPVFVDCRLLRLYEGFIAGALKSFIPDSDNASLKLPALHESGRLVILVDEYDPINETHLKIIKLIEVTYPRARMIVAARLPLLNTKRLRPVVGMDDSIFVELRPLTRGRVRELIRKWHEPSGFTVDQAVEEIVSRFHALGIPLTPVYVVIYLSILSQDKGFSPINTSTVIENFIEGVLEKYKPEYRFRSAFDFRDQISYLSFIAEKMCKLNKFQVDHVELYNWTREHFEYIGIEQDYNKVIEFFCLNKVFGQSANNIYFSYKIFLSFFIASQLHISAEFKAWMFSGVTFLSYVNEIDIYCGLNRNDLVTLEFLKNEFLKYDRKLAEMVAPLAWVDRLDQLRLPSIKEDEHEFVDRITKQLTEPNLSEDARDKALEKHTDQGTDLRPSISRPEVQGLIANWILSLRAYTVALKNLEGISSQTKEENLAIILEGWSTLVRYACLLFRDLIDKRELSIGHFHFILAIPNTISARFLRVMFLNIPLVISHFLRRDLGSQKLMIQLKKEYGDKSAAVSLLRTGLYADMKLNEYMAQLEMLRKRVDGLSFLQEALLVKLRDIYVRYNVGVHEQHAFRRLVGNLSADLKGLKGQARHEYIESYLSSLKKDAVIAKLKDG